MTSIAAALRAPARRVRRSQSAVPLPPLSPRLQVVRAGLLVLFALSAGLAMELLMVSSVQERAAQQRAFDQFRGNLAKGVAPVGPKDASGRALAAGTPVAYLEIPSIGLRQVVEEGTSGGTLSSGPGHRRDTPLPGQAGVSVVLGRKAAFGGPFARIDHLRRGATIRMTTGQGVFDYRVVGVRHAGDPAPTAPKAAAGRLLLATADGRPFLPSGVLRVDADLNVPATPGPARLLTSRSLPSAEQMMGIDTGTLWALALWLQALILVVLTGVWAWHRWHRAKAWAVVLPPLFLVFLATSTEAARLLPNLL